MISRRTFLEIMQAVGLTSLVGGVQSCAAPKEIKGRIVGANAAVGHRLRTMDFSAPASEIRTDVVIVGGGVAGLSAARMVSRNTSNFLLIEMESMPGGNALGGSNHVSAYPWGAHYLPVPGNGDGELISFLRECDVITGVDRGLPVYNEYYLCHDPKERLYINHLWQDGIIPHEGVPANDRSQLESFMSMMAQYKNAQGADGRAAFSIPVDQSSSDPEFTRLDQITGTAFLEEHKFTSPYLRWYVNYCCADDFGTSIDDISAWAMIHYFASRRGKGSNAHSDDVLTWPEGNFWLVNELRKKVPNIMTSKLVYAVSIRDNKEVVCDYFDVASNSTGRIIAKKAIMATPQFVSQRLLRNVNRVFDYNQYTYAPWMVANVTTSYPLSERRGEKLCWDNVIYGSSSLGYINASHQQVGQAGAERNITYYQPLLGTDPRKTREAALTKTFEQWRDGIVSDLKVPHPGIESSISNIDVWLWGHAMVRPVPNLIWSENRMNAANSIDGLIHFAHSDLSGMSIFEEAFYAGHRGASKALSL